MSIRGPLGVVPQSSLEVPPLLDATGAGSVASRAGTVAAPAGGLAARPAGLAARPGSLTPRSWSLSDRWGTLGLAVLLTAGLAVAAAAANTYVLLPESIRPYAPPGLAGAFAGARLNLGPGGAVVALGMMLAAYALVVARAGRLSGRMVLGAIVVLYGLILLAPPLISTDVFSYQAYARIGATYGANPYTTGPHAIALDPVFPYIGARWSYIPSVYGPLFTLLSYVLAPLGVAASVVAYKSIAALSAVGVVGLVWMIARARGGDPVRAAALVGLNPLLVVWGVGDGHNDLLMLLASMAGVHAVVACRERLGGGLTILATGLKLTAGLLLPFAIAAEGPRRGRGRRRDLLLGAGVALAVVAALSYALFGGGLLQMLGTINHAQHDGDWHSLSGFVSERLGLATLGLAISWALIALFALGSGWLLVRVWRGRLDWIAAAGWSTVLLLLAASSVMPWYACWALPLAALGRDRRLVGAVVALSAAVMAVQLLGYIPHNGSLFG